MQYIYNDGGRSYYQLPDSQHDCVVRAIAIAAGLSYMEVYQALTVFAPLLDIQGVNVYDPRLEDYLKSLGFVLVPITTSMQDIPVGRVIACTTGHYTAIVDGVIQDVRNEAHKAVSHYWVRGEMFNVVRSGKTINANPLNAKQALTMRRLFSLNYGGSVQLKAV